MKKFKLYPSLIANSQFLISMTRIEDKKNQFDELEQEVDKLKKKLKRKQSKKIFNCGSCFLLFIIAVIVVVGFLAYVFAKSGLKQIPFFTERFYHEPTPTYLVETSNLSEQQKDLLAQFKNTVSQSAFNQQKDGNLTIDWQLSQEQLTALLRDKVKSTRELNERIDYIQLAVLPENLELFARAKEPANLIITLNFSPEVKNGKFALKVVNFKVGDLKLPDSLGNLAFSYLTEKSLNSMLNLFANYGQLQDITLTKGSIIMEILINNLKDLI